MPEDKTKIELAPKATSNKYKGTPIPCQVVQNGKHLSAFLINGDVMPKLGDQIVVEYGDRKFTGSVTVIEKGSHRIAIATNTRN